MRPSRLGQAHGGRSHSHRGGTFVTSAQSLPSRWRSCVRRGLGAGLGPASSPDNAKRWWWDYDLEEGRSHELVTGTL